MQIIEWACRSISYNVFTSIARFTSGAGIVVDPDSDRLYWTDQGSWRIASSRRDGTGIETIVELESSVSAWGLAKLGNVIYWTDLYGDSLRSSMITGEDVATLHNGIGHRVKHLTLVPANTLSAFENVSNSNPCEGQGCSHICVLKAKSAFSCLCPPGLHLVDDQRTCVETNFY